MVIALEIFGVTSLEISHLEYHLCFHKNMYRYVKVQEFVREKYCFIVMSGFCAKYLMRAICYLDSDAYKNQ